MRVLSFILLLTMVAACRREGQSNTPVIKLIASTPELKVNKDTMYIQFTVEDADADAATDSLSYIYIKDTRFDSLGFIPNPFPNIDASLVNPDRGIKATVLFSPLPAPVPRLDTIHLTFGDTVIYEMYVRDKAGHESNHLTLPQVILKL